MKPPGAVGTLLRALGRRDGPDTVGPGVVPVRALGSYWEHWEGTGHSLGALGGHWAVTGSTGGFLGWLLGSLGSSLEAVGAYWGLLGQREGMGGYWGVPGGSLGVPDVAVVPPVCKVAAHKRCESKVTSPCQPLPPPELVSGGGARPPRSRRAGPRPPKSPSRPPNPAGPTRTPEAPPDRTPLLPSGPPNSPGRIRDPTEGVKPPQAPPSRRQDPPSGPPCQDPAPPIFPLDPLLGQLLGQLGPEQALNALSMRRFCEEKLGGVLQPSQRRYTEDFGALLSGRLRLNSSPQFLHHVLLPPLPAYDPPDGCRPFLKIYQSLQLVYTSGVYPPASQSLCVTLEPALLLKGDVMVRCYHRRRGGREAVFGVQFHTGTLRGPRLRLRRDELDLAWQGGGTGGARGRESPRSCGAWGAREDTGSLGVLGGLPHGRPPPPTAAERRELEQLLGGFGVRGGRESPGPGEEPPDTPEPLGTPTAYGSPEPLGTPAPYGNPTPYRSPVSHGAPPFHGTPVSHEVPPPHGAPLSYGTPMSHKTPLSHGTPPFHGTPAPHSPPTSCGTLTPHGFPPSCGAPKPQGSPTPYDTPKPYGTLVSHETLTFHGPPASQGSPTSYGTPAPHGPPVSPGTPISLGVPAPYGTPISHRTPISRGSPTFHGTPLSQDALVPNSSSVSQGTLTFPGSLLPYSPPASHGTPTSLETPTPYGTPTSQGSPSPYGTPKSYGTPPSHGSPTPQSPPPAQKSPVSYSPLMPHGTPIIHETLTPYGTPTSQETPAPHSPPTSYSPPKPHGTPASPGVPISHITPISEGLPAPHGTPMSHGPPASLSPPAPHGIPAPASPPAAHSLPVSPSPPSSWAPPSAWAPPCPPLCRRASLASPRDPPKRGVQRSLSEGFPPWGGYGRPVAGGYLLLGGLPPLCPCQDCQGWGGISPLPTRPVYGGHAWGAPPAPSLEPPSCPHCGRPGLGLERGPPPGKGGYAPPAVGEPQEPTGKDGGAKGLMGALGGVAWRVKWGGRWGPPLVPPPPVRLPRVSPAVSLLKAAPPGSFLVRRSSSFPGAFGLALRVGVPPPRAAPRAGDPQEQLVRHFLIETGPRGVKIRGCPEEPYFGSLPALVLQHSITPISLPCTLRIPHAELQEEPPDPPGPPNVSTAGALLRQGAGGAGGTGGLFFRRHYPVSSVTHCGTDPQERRWANPDGTTARIFGFVAKQAGAPGGGNACHVFAELDPEQPAGAIVTFVTKVLLGTRH
ncbi:tensin-2 [Onychostruthus taczanowskii]|uniref:tensin-2 n=1 Tax=Onychostruthus taczanowskii TaxID=356909 RepID=UPI001B806599|nr:tensin-2 [Onychostruthus taczanowskii]